MKTTLVIGFIIASLSSFAGNGKAHRHHEAHEHGAATLSIAFDQLKGKIEFKAASEGVLGFEHEAKSEKDKKTLSDAIAKFQTGISSMIKFDDSAACTFTADKVAMMPESEEPAKEEKHEKKNSKENHKEHHGEHSDFVAQFSVECKKDLKGTQLKLDFTQFKGLNDLDVTLLVGELQKSVEVKKKPTTVDLK